MEETLEQVNNTSQSMCARQMSSLIFNLTLGRRINLARQRGLCSPDGLPRLLPGDWLPNNPAFLKSVSENDVAAVQNDVQMHVANLQNGSELPTAPLSFLNACSFFAGTSHVRHVLGIGYLTPDVVAQSLMAEAYTSVLDDLKMFDASRREDEDRAFCRAYRRVFRVSRDPHRRLLAVKPSNLRVSLVPAAWVEPSQRDVYLSELSQPRPPSLLDRVLVVEFALPVGAYATVALSEILGCPVEDEV
jgi:tRNA(Glu) U13 pseudouridine synthase TruD